MRAVNPMELQTRQTELLDLALSGEILRVSSQAKESVVFLSETEFNKREKALRNAEYLAKLDKALEDTRENGGYVFDLKTGTFSDTPVKVNI